MKKHTISFRHAFSGLWVALISQLNLRIHVILGSMAILLATYLQVPISELLVLILTILIVIVVELVNTAIEFACNAVTLENNSFIKNANDVSAGAVLISAIFAVLIGFIIFVPKLLSTINY